MNNLLKKIDNRITEFYGITEDGKQITLKTKKCAISNLK
jgi:hypothetical protein